LDNRRIGERRLRGRRSADSVRNGRGIEDRILITADNGDDYELVGRAETLRTEEIDNARFGNDEVDDLVEIGVVIDARDPGRVSGTGVGE